MIISSETRYAIGYIKNNKLYLLGKGYNDYEATFFRFVEAKEGNTSVIYSVQVRSFAERQLETVKQAAEREYRLQKNYVSKEVKSRNKPGTYPRVFKLKERIDAIRNNDLRIVELVTSIEVKI